MELSNQQLTESIKQGDIAAFDELHREYYIFLCLIAEHIVRNPSDAEEIVSDVFSRVWNIRKKIDITVSIKAYLVKAVYNTSVNYLELSRISNKYKESTNNSDYKLLAWDSDYPLGQLYEKEIIDILNHGISTLPDTYREIFILSRNEDMNYSEIVSKQGISVNTVKTHMKIAPGRLRKTLRDYLTILLILMGI
jgi:RNA polymerase sigma-70 factor (ECF subfamily)